MLASGRRTGFAPGGLADINEICIINTHPLPAVPREAGMKRLMAAIGILAAAFTGGMARAEISGRLIYDFEAPDLAGLPPNGTRITMEFGGRSWSYVYQIKNGPDGPEGSPEYLLEGPDAVQKGLTVTVEYQQGRYKYKYKAPWIGPDSGRICKQLNLHLVLEENRWRLQLEKVEAPVEPIPAPSEPPAPPQPAPVEPQSGAKSV
jgi:hypothetical protein